jgi:hypothetical protein
MEIICKKCNGFIIHYNKWIVLKGTDKICICDKHE